MNITKQLHYVIAILCVSIGITPLFGQSAAGTMNIHTNKTKTPYFIQGKYKGNTKLSKESMAKEFLQKKLMGATTFSTTAETGLQFKTLKQQKDTLNKNDIIHVEQRLNNIPIFGSDVSVHINPNNEITVISGKVYNFSIGTTPAITSEDAITTAKNNIELAVSPPTIQSKLVIYMKEEAPILAWHITIATMDPLAEWNCFIDAKSGAFIFKFNAITDAKSYQTHHATLSGGRWTIPGSLILKNSEPSLTTDNVAITTHENISTTYDYYKTTFGRNSFDNNDALVRGSVHYNNGYDRNNAFYYGPPYNLLIFGDGDGYTFGPLGKALDIVGHEFAHAVTKYSANLTYAHQSGALNESMSDVFGALIERQNWMVGEDCYSPNTPGDALRYMDAPSRGFQPELMSNYYITESDNGGVHANSGIPNKAFYLYATAIGKSDAEQVYYRALTTYFTQSTDFSGARLGLALAAVDLFGEGSPQVTELRKSFNAVEISPIELPKLSLSPTSITITALENTPTYTQELRLTNSGSNTLQYTIKNISAFPNWLSVSSSSGKINKGDSKATILTASTVGLSSSAQFTLILSTDDPTAPEVSIPITIALSDKDELILNSLTIQDKKSYIANKKITVTNSKFTSTSQANLQAGQDIFINPDTIIEQGASLNIQVR